MLFATALLALHFGPVTPSVANRQPQLAAGHGMVAMVFGSSDSVWFARSPDGGRSFTPPARVGALPKLALGRHRGPRIAISGNAILVSAIETQNDLFCWRSTDGGRTWSKPVVINDRPTSAREGLHAMAGDAGGHVAVIWLDDRTPPGGKKLYGAFSDDAGATWSKNVALYQSPSGTICECCHPSLAAMGHGEFAAMWRNSLDGSRDLYVMRIRNGAPSTDPVKQGTGTWKLNACPMDGGGLAWHDGQIWSAWRREHDVYLARPGSETRLGTGENIALAANAKGAYAIWSNAQGIQALTPDAPQPHSLSPAGGFPSIVALPDGSVLAAWEDNDSIAVRRLH